MTGVLPEETVKQWREAIPLKRGGTPEDVANLVVFLASDLSSYITGQVIHCDGGMRKHRPNKIVDFMNFMILDLLINPTIIIFINYF